MQQQLPITRRQALAVAGALEESPRAVLEGTNIGPDGTLALRVPRGAHILILPRGDCTVIHPNSRMESIHYMDRVTYVDAETPREWLNYLDTHTWLKEAREAIGDEGTNDQEHDLLVQMMDVVAHALGEQEGT